MKRNTARDYIDFVALGDHLGTEKTLSALESLDRLYSQPNQQSPLQQLQIQLSNPLPFDLESEDLKEYKGLKPKWHSWQNVKKWPQDLAIAIFEMAAE